MANIKSIVAGIACIVALYTIPVESIQLNIYGPPEPLSIASTVSLCNNPLIYSSSCSFLPIVFYLGWIAGVILIVYGIFPEAVKSLFGQHVKKSGDTGK
jgi:hypothetical protein